MGSLLRSADMVHVRLYLENVAVHDTMEELGKARVVQLDDLNSHIAPVQRAYAAEIRRCDEMQRRLRYLCEQANIELDESGQPLKKAKEDRTLSRERLDDLSSTLQSLEKSLLDIQDRESSIQQHYREVNEMRVVAEQCAKIFKESQSEEMPSDNRRGAGQGILKRVADRTAELFNELTVEGGRRELQKTQLLGFIAGMIDLDKQRSFERVLFRATKGNCIVKSVAIPGERIVFVIFLTGAAAREKAEKVCTAFGASRYPMPDTYEEQIQKESECLDKLRDVDFVLNATRKEKLQSLAEMAPKLIVWCSFVRQQKAIFHASNMINFDTSRSLYIAEGWVASEDMPIFSECVRCAQRKSHAQAPSLIEEKPFVKEDEDPPTYFRLNRFTRVFQEIVESYGIAKYQEVNPAPFTVMTFPFLFAVMFGDIGHGILMAMFGAFLVIRENRLKQHRGSNEFFDMCFGGRYILLLMGLFSIFTGFIYNEFFAVPLNLFRGRWMFTSASDMACGIDNCTDPAAVNPPLKPYPLGMDPIWKFSASGLLFFNSFKMKLSIVLGVCHMMVGIFLSALNAIHFKDRLELFFVFVPQVIFMSSIFVYLSILVIVKWSTDWNAAQCQSDPHCLAPDLKNTLIDMFMAPGSVPESDRLFRGQAPLQVLLLLLALISVPWMLLPKPLILRRRNLVKVGYRQIRQDDMSDGSNSSLDRSISSLDEGDDDRGHGEAFDFQEVFVQQVIHTIEFVLGAVSNTASYLRLWALSLAHSELSDVFLEKLIFYPISMGKSLFIVIGFAVWLQATLGILMGLEALSAFLHALRLHWVEFQNKFYNMHGPGRKFEPFELEPADDL